MLGTLHKSYSKIEIIPCFLSEQFCCHSLVERIFQKLIYLQLEIFISIFFKKLFGIFVGYRFNFKATADSELDTFSITQHKSLVLDMLVDCIVQQVGKLIHRQIFRHKPRTVDIAYVLGKDFLASLCELDYLNEQFSDIICYQ